MDALRRVLLYTGAYLPETKHTRMFIAKQHRLLARAGLSETGGSGMYLFLWLRSASLTVDAFRDLRRLSTSSASYLKTP
jgi:hypothetical protein